nr:MAG TPA: hypothetical protein [Bacteriophage sp.]
MALTAKKVYAILKRQISDMEAKLNSPVRYRGTVATADLLPLNPDIGDMYNIESKSVYGEAGMNVAWNGVVWDTMGAPIDMSLYFTKEEAETVIQRLVTEYFEKNPVKPGATTEQAQQIEQNKTDIVSLKTETGSLKEDKITKPAETPTIGKILRVKSVNEDGTFICEWADGGGSNLDVRIDGKSIVQDGVAEIPKADDNTYNLGLIRVSTGNGFTVSAHGTLNILECTDDSLKKRYPRIVSGNVIDYAVKAAMCDGKGTAWTTDEQAAARERMGTWTTIADITLDEDVNIINAVSVQGYRKYSVVVLLSQPITADCYIQPKLICENDASGAVYESTKNKTFLFWDIEEFGYIGGENNSSLFGCESYKSEIGEINPNIFKCSTVKANYNIAGKFPYLTGIGVIANGASIPSGSRMIIRGHN